MYFYLMPFQSLPPSPPAIRLVAPPLGFDSTRAAKRAAKEMGAVVVVEDELPAFPLIAPSLALGRFRFHDLALPPNPMAMPTWMDPSVTRSGGNVVHRVFSIGGVGF